MEHHPAPADGLRARVRWGNLARALALVAIAALVVAWPRLRPATPEVPRGAAVPVRQAPAPQPERPAVATQATQAAPAPQPRPQRRRRHPSKHRRTKRPAPRHAPTRTPPPRAPAPARPPAPLPAPAGEFGVE